MSIVLLWGFWGCSDSPNKPANIIPEDQYVTLLIEKQLVRTYTKLNKADSTKIDSLADAIYERYDITESQFQKSHHYYQQFPKEQKERVKQATDQLKQELVTRQDTASSDTAEAASDSIKTTEQ